MQRSLAVVVALALVTACSSSSGDDSGAGGGGGGGDGDAGTGTSPEPGTGGSTDPKPEGPLAPLHVIGRVDRRDPNGPRFSWPGTQIRARFSGTGAIVQLRDAGTNQFDVSIDGAAATVLTTNDATESYTVATGLRDGEHDLIVTKRTESLFGVVQLVDVTSLEGRALVPTPEPSSRRIEFVGDSISCGYGVLGAEPCLFSADTESEPDAYTGLTADALSAERTTIAYSGLGMYRDYGGNTADQMPVRYTQSLADDATSSWDYSFSPDAIVVNLGTNDFAAGDPGAPFQEAYETFLAFLRSKHPKAHIVGTLSPMLSDYYPENANTRTTARTYVQGAIDARKAAGDTNVSFVEFDLQTGADGYGCDYHPNMTTQKEMSRKLATALRQQLHW